jgi:hypothetical protein
MTQRKTSRKLMYEILSYFMRNPDATDSLEGIARWRLLDQYIHRTLTETDEAIKALVEDGLLIRSSAASTGPLFSLNRDRLQDGEKCLEEWKPSGGARSKRRNRT